MITEDNDGNRIIVRIGDAAQARYRTAIWAAMLGHVSTQAELREFVSRRHGTSVEFPFARACLESAERLRMVSANDGQWCSPDEIPEDVILGIKRLAVGYRPPRRHTDPETGPDTGPDEPINDLTAEALGEIQGILRGIRDDLSEILRAFRQGNGGGRED